MTYNVIGETFKPCSTSASTRHPCVRY